MKVLVCGARNFDQPKVVARFLAELHAETPITLIISGGAPGVDRMAESWACHNRIALCVFPPNWVHEGKRAGPIRNARMMEFGKPDLVVAFPGGPGTHDMVGKATLAGVRLIEPMAARTAKTGADDAPGIPQNNPVSASNP